MKNEIVFLSFENTPQGQKLSVWDTDGDNRTPATALINEDGRVVVTSHEPVAGFKGEVNG